MVIGREIHRQMADHVRLKTNGYSSVMNQSLSSSSKGIFFTGNASKRVQKVA